MEGREFEECTFKDDEMPKFLGTKLPIKDLPPFDVNFVSPAWETICKIYENRNNLTERGKFNLYFF